VISEFKIENLDRPNKDKFLSQSLFTSTVTTLAVGWIKLLAPL